MNDTTNTSPTTKEPVRKEFNIGGVSYVYQFDLMSVDRIFNAYTLFKLWIAMYKQLPSQASDVKIIAERQTLKYAFAAILMKVMPHGGFEPYSPSVGTELMGQLTGKDYQTLLEAQYDFFQNSGLWEEYSQMQQQSQISGVMNVIKSMDASQIKVILPILAEIADSQNTSGNPNSEKTTLIRNFINTASENLSTGQSSGSQQTTTPSDD